MHQTLCRAARQPGPRGDLAKRQGPVGIAKRLQNAHSAGKGLDEQGILCLRTVRIVILALHAISDVDMINFGLIHS